MSEKYLKNALEAAGIPVLPKKKKEGEFKGLAVIKMKQVGGSITWGLGRWNSELKRVNVARDFGTKMVDEIIEVYPFEKVELAETPEKMEARIRAEFETKSELDKLEVEYPENAKLDELKALLNAKKAEISNSDLNVALDFLRGLGYKDTYLKRLDLEAAQVSVKKMKAMQNEITELGETPASTKDEMEDQLKELNKK